MNIDAAQHTSIGNRATNEDSHALLNNNKSIIALVADGLGGEGHGDMASRIAVETIGKYLLLGGDYQVDMSSRVTVEINNNLSCDTKIEDISDAINAANMEINKHHSTNGNKMKSTIAALYISEKKCYAAHVGDTRIYQFRNNKIIYQSIDHSVSQMAVIVGEIKVDEIRSHADRNKLTRSLGAWDNIEADVAELFIKAGDAFLLCSDGFWEHVFEQDMCSDLATSNTAAEWLTKMRKRVEQRITPTGDNHSAITIIFA